MKLIKIGWADAIENLYGWHTKKQSLKWAKNDNWIVHQVGWILEETDDYILFTSQYNQATAKRKETFSGLFKVPKPWILYREEI